MHRNLLTKTPQNQIRQIELDRVPLLETDHPFAKGSQPLNSYNCLVMFFCMYACPEWTSTTVSKLKFHSWESWQPNIVHWTFKVQFTLHYIIPIVEKLIIIFQYYVLARDIFHHKSHSNHLVGILVHKQHLFKNISLSWLIIKSSSEKNKVYLCN